MKRGLIILLCIMVISFILYLALNIISNQEQAGDYSYYNKTIEIIDGDTFKTSEGETIRLLCVDTPEKNQEGYDEAVSFLTQRLLSSPAEDIVLEGNKTDKYNRSLRWVYVNGTLINKEIIDLGFGSLFEYEGEDCKRVK